MLLGLLGAITETATSSLVHLKLRPLPHPAGLSTGTRATAAILALVTSTYAAIYLRTKMLKSPNTHLSSFLLKLLNGSLVDSTAFVDQMAGGGGLSGVDVANNHDVNVDLFLSHD